MPRTWTTPTLPKATVENSADPVLGWTVQHTAGPTHNQPYAPWETQHKFVFATDVVDPASAPTTATAASGGTLAAATYTYAYTWGTAKSQTGVSATVGRTTSGSTSTVTVTVPALPSWADRTYVYRQVGGVNQLLGTTVTTTYLDDGSVTPNASLVAPAAGAGNAAKVETTH